MKSTLTFYEPSNGINLKRAIPYYILGIITILLLSYLYNTIIVLMPIIYLNFLLTIGFGIAIGYVVRMFLRLAHIRGNRIARIFLISFILFALFFSWSAFLSWALLNRPPSLFEYLNHIPFYLNPFNSAPLIRAINLEGPWSIGEMTIKGFPLTVIWIFEVLLITLGMMFVTKKRVLTPYSELMEKWYPKFVLQQDFEAIHSAVNLKRALQEDVLKTIRNLENGNGFQNTKIHVHYIKGEAKQYISFIRFTVEDRGRGKTNKVHIINLLEIDSQTADAILAEHSHKKDKTEII